MSQPGNSGHRDGGARIAFFGGSFDPPHLGHLAVAHAALAAMPLDSVLFAPVGTQPLKPAGSTASFEDRVEMTRLAISNEPAFKLSLADAPRVGGKPNYSLETLEAVKRELPQNGTLYCLMGADSFAALRQWYRAAEIAFVAPLIVASRPGQPLDNLREMLPVGLSLETGDKFQTEQTVAKTSKVALQCYTLLDSAGRWAPFYVLPDVDVPVSASEIRQRINRRAELRPGSEERSVLPEGVAEYIRSRGLYR